MRIVELRCRSCGATLQIGANADELACGHCGSLMLVDRSSGAISLQLVTAVGDIRTGGVRIEAELALPRLKAEKADCARTIALLEGLEERYVPTNILTDSELADAQRRAAALEAQSKELSGRGGNIIGVWLVMALVMALWALSSTEGFFNIVGALLGVWVIWAVGMALVGFLSARANSDPHKERADLEGRIDQHQAAIEQRSTLAQLEEARAELARIEAEITQHRSNLRQSR